MGIQISHDDEYENQKFVGEPDIVEGGMRPSVFFGIILWILVVTIVTIAFFK